MKYGRSLSFCVREILEGKVRLEEVGCIVSSTKFSSVDEIMESSYLENYWRGFSRKKILMVLTYLGNGRLIQPRLYQEGLMQALYRYPIWANSFKECIDSLECM